MMFSGRTLVVAIALVFSLQAQTLFKMSGKAGHAVRLGGVGFPWDGQGLHWSIIGRPAGSTAVLLGASSPLPRFFPDKQGIYVLQGAGASASPTILVAVGPGHTLAPAQTRVLNGDHYDIVVDGVHYAGPAPFSMPGFNIVALRRDDLQLVDHFTSPGNEGSIKDYLDGLLAKQGADVLVIIATNDSAGFRVSDIAPELKKFGANNDFDGAPDFPFSFIGIKGTNSGQAYQVGRLGQASLSLDGYFAPDSSSNYAFIQTDYASFEVNPSKSLNAPSTVTIGNRVIASSQPNACPGGGFLLAIVDRASLEATFSQSYCTLADTPEHSITQQQALAQKLTQEQQGGARQDMIFLVSFGQAHNGASPDAADFARLAQMIGYIGGTYEAVYAMNAGDTYSLVTSSTSAFAAGEAGSQISSSEASGVLKGELGRGRLGNWYAPITSTTGVGNLGLYQILSQPAEAFPIPAAGDAGQRQAYSYISQKLCGAGCNNIRAAYEDTSIDIDQLTSTLAVLPDPQNPNIDCDHTTLVTGFCAVRAQLLSEFRYASNLRHFNDNVSELWDSQQSNISLILNKVTTKVNESVKPPPESNVTSIVENVVGTLLSVASAVSGPAAPIFGVINAAFSFGTNLANTLDGNSTVLDVNVPAANVAIQAADSFAKQKVAFGVMMDSVYEDFGRLEALGTALGNPDDPNWRWNGETTTGQLLQGFDTVTEISDYRSLLPTVWTVRVWNAQSSAPSKPWDYTYNAVFNGEHSIFPGNTPALDFISEPSPRVDPKTAKFEPDILTIALPGELPFGPGTTYHVPQAEIPNHLYGVRGLGVWKSDVFRHWRIPKLYCTTPGAEYHPIGGGISSDCDREAPQLPQ